MPKRYARIGNHFIEVPGRCNICGKDMSSDPAHFHFGNCPKCGKETRHIIAVLGLFWSCRESHGDDASVCASCGKQLAPESVMAELIRRGVGATRKRFCSACNPLVKKK